VTRTPRPPFDPELEAVLPMLDGLVPDSITLADVETLRASTTSPPIDVTLRGRPIRHTERTIPGPAGAPGLTVSVFERADHTGPGPGIVHTHGGGMMGGDRFVGAGVYLDWVEQSTVGRPSTRTRLRSRTSTPLSCGLPSTRRNSGWTRRGS
jgi:acetyl esterase/lipase